MAINHVEFLLHGVQKKSSENLLVYFSPDRADILPSRSVGTAGQGR
jgi:hypothetical protein